MNTIKKNLTQFFLLDTKGRFAALDGLKGYAAVLVFLYHASQHTEPFLGIHNTPLYARLEYLFTKALTFFPFIGTAGSCIGVDMLFEISGFLIFISLSRHNIRFLRFIKNRFLRLLPAHIATILIYSVAYSPLVIILNALFLQDLVPHTPIINFVTWTITYEIFFYILLFLWMTFSKKVSSALSWLTLGVIPSAIWILQWIIPQNYESGRLKLFYLARFCSFFFGVALAKLYVEKPHLWNKVRSALPYVLVVTLALFAYWKNIWEPSFYRSWRILYYPILDILLFVIIGSTLTQSHHFIKRIFSNMYIRIVGAISYSFYLVHGVIGIPLGLKAMEVLQFQGIGKVTVFYICSFGITIVIATFLFHFFEKPYFTRKHT